MENEKENYSQTSSLMENNQRNSKSSIRTLNIENVDFNSTKKTKVNSPRSLRAMKQLGYSLDELYFLTLKDFKAKNPEVRALPPDIFKNRYEYFETRRLEKLNEIKELRLKLSVDKVISNTVNDSKQNPGEMTQQNFKSTAVSNDIKSFERMKKKQEMELLGLVQYEIQKELRRKENEEKMRLQKEKQNILRNEVLMKQKKQEQEKLERENERADQKRKEEEERKKRDKDKYMEEQKRLREEAENEKKRIRENMIKLEEMNRKKEEYERKVGKMFEENRRKVDEKQKFLEEKGRERRDYLEKKNLEQMMLNLEKAQMHQEQMENNLKSLEQKLAETRKNFLDKQARNDEKKKRFENLRLLAFKEKKDKAEKKAEEIKRVLETNNLMEKKKQDDYDMRQMLIQFRKSQQEEINKEEQKKKLEMQRDRDEKFKQTLVMNNIMESEKKKQIMAKIEAKEENTRKVHTSREMENMQRSEMFSKKQMERKENIRKITMMQANEREMTNERLQEKSQKVEEFMTQKSIITEKKREMQDDISRKKQQYTERFNNIFQKKSFDENTMNSLQRMFPGNSEIKLLVESLKNPMSGGRGEKFTRPGSTTKLKVEKSNHSVRPNSYFLKSVYAQCTQLTENEINQKVSEYKITQNKELLKILADERQKEDHRERILAGIKDKGERQVVEKQFCIERADVSNAIMKKNDEIEKRILEYELQLRNTKCNIK